jgi:Protein of unknown function (DUF2380)
MLKIPAHFLTVAFLFALCGGSRAAEGVTPIAVLDLAYIDTSGEPKDQAAVHEKRAADFVAGLKRDLTASDRYRIVPLTCGSTPCASDANSAEVQAAAQAAGAKLVVVGAVHKMSTLIEWVKIDVANTVENEIVFDKLITFRGDTDDAWERAERFSAREILNAAL